MLASETCLLLHNIRCSFRVVNSCCSIICWQFLLLRHVCLRLSCSGLLCVFPGTNPSVLFQVFDVASDSCEWNSNRAAPYILDPTVGFLSGWHAAGLPLPRQRGGLASPFPRRSHQIQSRPDRQTLAGPATAAIADPLVLRLIYAMIVSSLSSPSFFFPRRIVSLLIHLYK
jgi:hypothetical protein